VLAASIIRAVSTSDMLVNFYQTTKHNNPEDHHLHTHRRENLKSHFSHTFLEFVEFAVLTKSTTKTLGSTLSFSY
jgi:hypothetical protein